MSIDFCGHFLGNVLSSLMSTLIGDLFGIASKSKRTFWADDTLGPPVMTNPHEISALTKIFESIVGRVFTLRMVLRSETIELVAYQGGGCTY